jgi:hypothetical protein
MRSRRAEDDALVPAPLSVGWRDAPRTGVRWPSQPKELLLLPLRYMALQIKPPALGLDQDIGIN